MLDLSGVDINNYITFPQLIERLKEGFSLDYMVPERSHFDLPVSGQRENSTILIMPAWKSDAYFGIKTIIVVPDNHQKNLPTVQGTYQLFDAKTGEGKTFFDAKSLTNFRTAAASALASQFLSKPDSQTLLMVGTGSLAPFLIRAHTSVRPLQKILVWGRNPENAQKLANHPTLKGFDIQAIESIEQGISQADIISAATSALNPILFGKHLRGGQHLDLVGSFKPNMREVDDAAITRSKLFVDIKSTAPKESGDLAIPLEKGVIQAKDILADLFDLCRGSFHWSRNENDITLFKSVGHALEDLVAAQLFYESYRDQR